MKRTVLMLILILLVFSSSAWAEDIVAIWKDKNSNSMQLSYRDDTHIRMEMPEQGYMLVTKDKVYMVTGENGQWRAIDMDEMAGIMKAFGHGASEAIADETASGRNRLKDSGRTEIVAGYKGKIYLAEEEQPDGSMKQVEIVLSTHADIEKINRAWITISTRLGELFGPEMAQSMEQTIKESKQKNYGGLLRYADALKLSRVSKENLGSGYFELPENVTFTKMPQFPTGAAGNAPFPPAEEIDETTESDASTQTDGQDTNNQLKEDLNKGVRKLFKKLF